MEAECVRVAIGVRRLFLSLDSSRSSRRTERTRRARCRSRPGWLSRSSANVTQVRVLSWVGHRVTEGVAVAMGGRQGGSRVGDSVEN